MDNLYDEIEQPNNSKDLSKQTHEIFVYKMKELHIHYATIFKTLNIFYFIEQRRNESTL